MTQIKIDMLSARAGVVPKAVPKELTHEILRTGGLTGPGNWARARPVGPVLSRRVTNILRGKVLANMFRVDDRVRVRWLVQSDCLGLTGTVLDVQPSVFLGRDVQWCWGDLAVGIVRTTISATFLGFCEGG